jgi:large subunit ribosomal protein L19
MFNFAFNFLKNTAMGRDDIIRYVDEQLNIKPDYPNFRAGDTITVHYKIKEGNKERIQQFQGVVIQIKGKGLNKTFTVRKISNNVGVERIFPFTNPNIAQIDLNKKGRVRRARIYYFRELRGKKAKIKERRVLS